MSDEDTHAEPEASDPLIRLEFWMHENRGVYALLVGPELSRAAGIQTGCKITADLIRRVAVARGETGQAEWEECKGSSSFPQLSLKSPHPQVISEGSSARTSPDFSLSLSR